MWPASSPSRQNVPRGTKGLLRQSSILSWYRRGSSDSAAPSPKGPSHRPLRRPPICGRQFRFGHSEHGGCAYSRSLHILSVYLPSVTSIRSFYLPYTELSLLPGVHCPRHSRIPQAQARMDPRRATRRGHIQDVLRSEYTAKSCALGQSCRVRGGDITG